MPRFVGTWGTSPLLSEGAAVAVARVQVILRCECEMDEGLEGRVREELERARESWARERQVEMEREESKGRMIGAKAMGVKGAGRGKGAAMVIDLTFEDDD